MSGTGSSGWRRIAFERGGILALTIAVLYVWIAPAYLVDGDSAELATVGRLGGVAHPPGYPLYVLYLRATSWLPVESATHGAAIATAILGAAQAWVLHAACRAWGARALAATIAVAVIAAGPVVLRVETETEVFALNGLIAATVLWLAADGCPIRPSRRVVLLGLVAGLGIANHPTCVFLAPVGVLGLVRALRTARENWRTLLGLSIAAFVIGLTPYLYLLVAPDNAASWGPVDGLGGLLAHFLRSDYGGPGTFAASSAAAPVADNLRALLSTLGRGWLWLPLLAGLLALGIRIARPGEGSRWPWVMLATSFLLAGPLLVTRFNIPTSWVSLYVARRFHILPLVVLAIPVAVALQQIGTRLASHVRGSLVRSLPAMTCAATLGFVGLAAVSLPGLARIHSPALELGIRNLLGSLPPSAVVIQSQDQLLFGATYLQEVDGARVDVLVISWPLRQHRWYRDRWTARGISLTGDEPTTVDRLIAAGYPVFIDIYQRPILEGGFTTYPVGGLTRVLPRGAARPSLDEILALNKRLFERFDLGYDPPSDDDEYAADMHRKYAATWFWLARELRAAGRIEDARWCSELARGLSPTREAVAP